MKQLPIFYKVVGFLAVFYIFFKYLINFVMPPLPQSLILMYLFLAVVATTLYISLFEERMQEFWDPVLRFIRSNEGATTGVRWVVLVAVPFLAGLSTFQKLTPTATPPLEQRVIHPAPPREYAQLYNPIPHTPENILAGKGMFIAYCSPCHGKELNGKGPAAVGFNPPPANFVDPGTIAQLQESFLFWRISTGGVGLPVEGKPWNSAMPRWETRISPDNIWRIIMYEYEGSGHKPRTWE
jgi:hypothetical protein